MQHHTRANVDYSYRTTDIVARYIAPTAVVHFRKGSYADPLQHMDHIPYAAAGECFFACIAKAVYNDGRRHQEIRNNICNFLQNRLDRYSQLSAPEKILLRTQVLQASTTSEQYHNDSDVRLHGNFYIQHMRKPGTSADNTEIGVACNLYRLNIKMFSYDTVQRRHAPVQDFDAEVIPGNDAGRYVPIAVADIAILHEYHRRGDGSSRVPLQMPGQPTPSQKQRADNNANQDSGHYTMYAVKSPKSPPAAAGDEPNSAPHAAALLRAAYHSRNQTTVGGLPPAARAPCGAAHGLASSKASECPPRDGQASRTKGYLQYYDKEIQECESVHRSLEALHQKYARLVQVQIDKKAATMERLEYMRTCRAYYADGATGGV